MSWGPFPLTPVSRGLFSLDTNRLVSLDCLTQKGVLISSPAHEERGKETVHWMHVEEIWKSLGFIQIKTGY